MEGILIPSSDQEFMILIRGDEARGLLIPFAVFHDDCSRRTTNGPAPEPVKDGFHGYKSGELPFTFSPTLGPAFQSWDEMRGSGLTPNKLPYSGRGIGGGKFGSRSTEKRGFALPKRMRTDVIIIVEVE